MNKRAVWVTLLWFAAVLAAFAPAGAQTKPEAGAPAGSPPPAPATLRVDPLLIAEAGEAWGVIASSHNPIWPGWDASRTPLLVYLPGKQDVLINHPSPAAGFRAYAGPVSFPGGKIWVKDGPTLVEWDGQNTSMEVNGVQTLVVADTLSNLRSQVSGLLQDPRPAGEKIQGLQFQDLARDPYDQLAMVVHEAFHVFQDERAPDKGADESLLMDYPVLSVPNNVGFAQEGAALAQALRAKNDAAFRRAVVRWLALRMDRRSGLSPKAAEYEDGVEFTEGLAKYTEYRLFQVLEGRLPGPAMRWAQGFRGYGDLSPQRENLIGQLEKHMSGEVLVNGDPYGTAPLRMRLYFSGMAVGAVLDRLSPAWKGRILAPDATLTSLAEEAVHASQAELDAALQEARSEAAYAPLVEKKALLAREGRARAETLLKEIESGEGIGLIVDYSELGSTKPSLGFTPFGITRVDDARTIFTQVPIAADFGKAAKVAEKVPAPFLHDTQRRIVRFRLTPGVARAEVEKALGPALAGGGEQAGLDLDIPGATVKAEKARIQWKGNDLTIVLLKSGEQAPRT